MKNKILKIVTVMLLLMALTMTNFIYVGAGLISYAASSKQTNHQNVEFDAKIKDNNKLSIQVDVKNEGYFNGTITLADSNFKLKQLENTYIQKIEDNTITLNQINAGTSALIEIEIEPVEEEQYNAGLLDVQTKVSLNGIYRDRKQKDIKIEATREVKLDLIQNISKENIENSMEVITNKILKISGEEKRVIQLSINMGLKENNYPIKAIDSKIIIPSIGNKNPEVVKKVNLNNMTDYNFKTDGSQIDLGFTNNPNGENKILWKKQGNENIVLTLIYDKDVQLENNEINLDEKVTLYNNNELKITNKIKINNEEKDKLIDVISQNTENSIYKGKLYSSIDRKYETKTKIAINVANIEEYISIKEDSTKYIVNNEPIDANVVYEKTTINKEEFDKVLGKNGKIIIYNQNGELLATVDKNSEVDSNNDIIIDYQDKQPSAIEIKTTNPIAEGDLEFTHVKTIKANKKEIIKEAQELVTNVDCEYGTNVVNKTQSKIKLEESKTEVNLKVNKDTLSTVVENNVEIRAILKGENEKYNLYKNPSFAFELPQEVENININSIDLIYETELKVRNYKTNGRIITVELEGEQTKYKDTSVEGAIIVLNLNINVNKKVSTRDTKIRMAYKNDDITGTNETSIKIVAPKDVTAIQSIKELGVETVGQEDSKKVNLQRGTDSKKAQSEIEVINNNENAIENVTVMGTFPTKSKENNIDITLTNGINLVEANGSKIYYTENESATEDLKNSQNQWNEELQDASKVKKYLITVPKIDAGSSVKGTYETQIPEQLEYNQVAKQGYSVKYTNELSKSEGEIKATTIELETGVGPKAETRLVATMGGKELEENATVKNGEVIRYKIEVSNVGSEELKNVVVQGNVPEGTTLVEPQENYEYTGTSYYKELSNRTYQDNIEVLKVGEVITKEYEVRVNNNVSSGTKLSNTTKIVYGDVTKTSNSKELATKKGDIRVTVKRVTDRNVDLYEAGTVQYFAIIENISNQKQDNVKVKTDLPETLNVERLTLFTGMEAEEVSSDDLHRIESSNDFQEETRKITENELTNDSIENKIQSKILDYKEELSVGALEAGEAKVLSYDMSINKVNDENKQINFIVRAINGKEEYTSNSITDNVKQVQVELNMTSNTSSKYLKAGDNVEYTITVKNNSQENIEGLNIKDVVPSSLSVNKVSVNGEEHQELKGRNNIEIPCNMQKDEQKTITMETAVNYSQARIKAEPITNVANAELLSKKVATTQEVNHIIEANESANNEENTDNDNNDNIDEDNNIDNNNKNDNDIAKGTKMITGIAWFDENANGQKDDNETTLSNIKVHLLNTKTNNLIKDEDGNTLEATTNNNGVYVLNNISDGEYIVIFDYDKTKYSLTKYKAENVPETNNSNVMSNELQIGNEKEKVASTDIIQVNNQNISDINIGLIKLQNFDLKLEKFVSKIIIQNSKGTTSKQYNDATVAKAELDGKKINGTNVIIEYKIRVTNVGEIDGYARKIVDYMPNDLKFSSELNKDWYQSGEGLHNTSLANEKIKAGESREITLTLTKSMTENNVGLINNTAEIEESYNELGIEDSNSTPANKVKGENDLGSADVILSLKTGGIVYLSIVVAIAAILGVTAYVIIRKKSKNGDKK